MMIKLQPGDYVATADIKDEDEYHAVAKAFMDAGCKGFPEDREKTAVIFGWSSLLGEYGWETHERCGSFTRQLTPAQILSTPQWVPEVGDRVRLIADEEEVVEVVAHWNDKAVYVEVETGEAGIDEYYNLSPLPTEEDRAVEEMLSLDCEPQEGMLSRSDFCRKLYQHGYRKQPQPAEDKTNDDLDSEVSNSSALL